MENKHSPEIWVIGGGKGGTGKTFLISSIGLFLARKGKRVIYIDSDIGGANLHSFLGLDPPKATLTDFFEKKIPLADLVCATDIPGVSFIPGDIHSLASDTIRYGQKRKLYRHMRKLEADYLLIDLGAGSHYITIDTFLQADKTLTVIVPELIAVENLYHFVKNTLFRKIRLAVKAPQFKEIVWATWRNKEERNISSLRDLVLHLQELPDIGPVIREEMEGFRVRLLLNKARNNQDIFLGSKVKSTFIKHLGIDTLYTGFVEYDERVFLSSRRSRPFILEHPDAKCSRELEAVTDNLLWEREVRLMRS
jgi:flagellar biosynthesis protein FlhG